MSDVSDVLVVLANAALLALYPNGTNSPSVVGSDIIIYPGWPASDTLDQDLTAGKTHVSVFPKPEERNTTRYRDKSIITTAPSPTITLKASLSNGGRLLLESGGNVLLEDGSAMLFEGSQAVVTLGGTVSAPQNVMLRINNRNYVYAVQVSDPLAVIAANLASLVAADISGTASQNASITLGATGRLQAARVGGFGTVTREIRRQERIVMLTIWAGTPALRDAVASAIDVALADQRFLAMPDGYAGRIIYKNSLVVDSLQKATLYRRDLNYSVEFATTSSQQAAAVIAPGMSLNNSINVTI